MRFELDEEAFPPREELSFSSSADSAPPDRALPEKEAKALREYREELLKKLQADDELPMEQFLDIATQVLPSDSEFGPIIQSYVECCQMLRQHSLLLPWWERTDGAPIEDDQELSNLVDIRTEQFESASTEELVTLHHDSTVFLSQVKRELKMAQKKQAKSVKKLKDRARVLEKCLEEFRALFSLHILPTLQS